MRTAIGLAITLACSAVAQAQQPSSTLANPAQRSYFHVNGEAKLEMNGASTALVLSNVTIRLGTGTINAQRVVFNETSKTLEVIGPFTVTLDDGTVLNGDGALIRLGDDRGREPMMQFRRGNQ